MPKIERLIIPQPITPLTENDRPQAFILPARDRVSISLEQSEPVISLKLPRRLTGAIIRLPILDARTGEVGSQRLFTNVNSRHHYYRGGSGRSRRERANCQACMNQHTGEHTCGSLSFNQSLGPKI